MAVTEDNITIPGTADRLDTVSVTQTDGTVVHREAVNITDPETLEARAAVVLQYPEKTYGMAVGDRGLEFLRETLSDMLGELKTMNRHLAAITDEEYENDDS